MEKARSADSGSAGLAASHINNRASKEKLPQNNSGVKENGFAKSDYGKFSARKGENDVAQAILEQENVQMKENISHLKELLKLQRTITNGTKFTKTSVDAAARMLDTQKAEAAHRFGNFEAYRRSMMGSVVIAKDTNTSLDSLWLELSVMYPDEFNLDNKKQVIGNNCLFLFLCS